MSFSGYPTDGLHLLTRIGAHDRAWFDRHRDRYQAEIVAPTKHLVTAVGDALARDLSADIVAQPRTNGSIAPINNDVRFARDTPPYKDHLLLRFWEGRDKKVAPTLFVRVSEPSIGFATGVQFSSLDRWRQLIDDEQTGGALAASLGRLARGRTLEVVGQALKRVPAPYATDHPRADLLRHKGLQARWGEPTPAAIHSTKFVDWCVRRLMACREVHRWLVTHTP